MKALSESSVSARSYPPPGDSPARAPSAAISRRRGQQVPEALAVVSAPVEWHANLQASLGTLTKVHYAKSVADCAALISRTNSIAVLITIPARANDPALDDYRRLRTLFQQTPFIAFYVSGCSDLRALAALAAADVRHVLQSDRLHSAEHVYSALAASESWSLALRVWRQAGITVGDELSTLMLTALRLGHEPLAVPRLALAAQMHERTLRKYCDRHRLPTPQWLIGWARCLIAAYYLEERGRSIQSIADIMHFNSAVLLANHVKRYSGLTASELRRRGPLTTCARQFEEFVRTPTKWTAKRTGD
ncbi:MAG: helix-turn-helix domain-containing protein [Gemmatimonadaceae bacterium]|nr:helix-turn-helix domain-containing protein [Gemmatimonadaceae bacterium]